MENWEEQFEKVMSQIPPADLVASVLAVARYVKVLSQIDPEVLAAAHKALPPIDPEVLAATHKALSQFANTPEGRAFQDAEETARAGLAQMPDLVTLFQIGREQHEALIQMLGDPALAHLAKQAAKIWQK